jgi:putative MATE family efflux protein
MGRLVGQALRINAAGTGMSADDRLRDLPTVETLPAHVARLALPVLGEQLLAFSVSMFDVYLAGRIGAVETSAIGLASYVGWMAALIFGLIRTGTAALVARRWGAGAFADAERILARSIFLALGLALFVLVLLMALAPLFATLLTMEGAARAVTVEYLRWDACGQACLCLTMVGAAALRGTGDMRTPLAVLTATNLVNVTLSPALVFGWGPWPRLGVTGIVLGTVTAQATGLVLMLLVLTTGITRIRLLWPQVRWDRDIAARILRIGVPAALDGTLRFAGHFLFLMVIARLSRSGFDEAIFAAHVIGIRVEALSYLPAEAWGIASASLAGRLLGATSPDVALRTGHVALRQFLWYPIVVSLAYFFGAEAIYASMHSDPVVVQVGVPAFRLMALCQVPNACLIIYVMTLIGAGDTRFPMWCSLACSLGVRVPVAYLCGVWLEGGLFGAWIGMSADNLLRAGLIAWHYRAGVWVQTRV